MNGPAITVSIVSHAQNSLVNPLLEDLGRFCAGHLKVIVTENVAERTTLELERANCATKHITNRRALGFAANHNQAFRQCDTRLFCVLNPDIRLHGNPFPVLASHFTSPIPALVAPLVRSPRSTVEDSARRFPTPRTLLRKMLRTAQGADYPTDGGPVAVDWVAGMFMLFSSEAFRAVQGFDERYFLYYEDVDICRRLVRSARQVLYDPRVEVIHDAQRGSRRNARLAMHHARSALRYFLTG